MSFQAAGETRISGIGMDTSPGALLTDLYQLNMVQAYLEAGQTGTAVFEFFVR